MRLPAAGILWHDTHYLPIPAREHVLRLTFVCFLLLLAGPFAIAQSGLLDPSFDLDGIRRDPFGSQNDDANIVKVLPDNSVIVAGEAHIATTGEIILKKFKIDGSPDSSFGANGQIIHDLGVGSDQLALAMAIQTDGNILVAGTTDSITLVQKGLVLRLQPDGSRDVTFGNNGAVIIGDTSGSNSTTLARSIAVNNNNGKIIVACSSVGRLVLCQLNADGTRDVTFGYQGIIRLPVVNYNAYYPVGIAYQSDGKIITAGDYLENGSYDRIYLRRFEPTGVTDSSFGISGMVVTNFVPGFHDAPLSFRIQRDDKTIIAGETYDSTGSQYSVVRYNMNGSLDSTFGQNGHVSYRDSALQSQATDIAIQPDDKYVIAGRMTRRMARQYKVSLLRLNVNGQLDNTFGSAGEIIQNIDSLDFQVISSVDIAPDGKIVVCGTTGNYNGVTSAFTARYLSGLHVGISDLRSTASAVLIYPNPIHQTETLIYTLSSDERVSLNLYTTEGRLVQEFMSGQARTAGEQVETLAFSTSLPSGTYVLRLTTGQGACSIRVTK